MASFIVMECEEVLDLCEQALERIEASRDNERQRLIQQEIDSRKWWRRVFFWLPELDEKTAREKLEANMSFGSNWYWIPLRHGQQENTVLGLQRLAEKALDGLVNVTAKDLEAIQ